MGTFYEAPNDYRSYLAHHGVKGMHWGVRKQYPIIGQQKSAIYSKISRNPLISELQLANARRNQAKYRKETAEFDKKNSDLKAKKDKLMNDHYDYISNKWNAYGKDKKFTAGLNKWISESSKRFEQQTGKSGENHKKYMLDAVQNRYNDDRDQTGFDIVQEYLGYTDKDYNELYSQMRSVNDEYRNKRKSYGKRKNYGYVYEF